jgi:hypothetical protein
LPLIIGVVVGGIGFLALTGFLIWYALRRKRRSAMKGSKDDFDKVKEIKSKPTKLKNESSDSDDDSDDDDSD